MNVLIAVAAFAVALGVLVIVHEFGHYLTARLCGVTVLRFSIGFGKRLATWRHPKSGTEWTLSALPLGGYVKMLDEREAQTPIEPAQLRHAFNRQSVGKRIAIVIAGPVANFLLAIALFTVVLIAGVSEPAATLAPPPADTAAARAGLVGAESVTGLRPADETEVEPVRSWSDLRWKLTEAAMKGAPVVLVTGTGAAQATHRLNLPRGLGSDEDVPARLGLYPGGGPLQIASVEPGGAASRDGLRAGDTIRAIDGVAPRGAADFVEQVKHHPGAPLTVDVERHGQPYTLHVTPDARPGATPDLRIGRIGAALADTTRTVEIRYGPLEATRLAMQRTWDLSVFSLRMFGRMIVGEASLKNLSGPVTIADYAGKSAQMGWTSFLSFLALVSISLGVLNLLPIPVLDGGHLLYYAAEAVTGRAISDRWQSILQRVGIVCILALSALALVNDLTRLIRS